MIFDTFMFNDEFDILECRVRELEDVPHLIHVVVEADVDHQDHPKPYHFLERGGERFAPWADRIRSVQATGLPTAAENPDPWSREHAQREHAFSALTDAQPDDVILHGDVDEIPTALAVRNFAAPGWGGFRVCQQKLYCFAVDWFHPGYWRGTVIGHMRDIAGHYELADVRSMRGFAEMIPEPLGGWHLSWLGGRDAALRKLGSFCHPEVAGRTEDGIRSNYWLEQGWHVDGTKMEPVDVDDTWPKWIASRQCPESWFRPRDVPHREWVPPRSAADVH